MCPKCNSKQTGIYNSRKNGKHGGSVWRRRHCLKCFHNWSTVEIKQEHYDELTNNANLLKTLRTIENAASNIIGKVKGVLPEDGNASHVYDDSYDPNRDYLQYIQDKKSREAKRLSNLRPVNRKKT
jgi:hypothetical protein